MLRELVYQLSLGKPTPSNNVVRAAHFHAYKRIRREWQGLVIAALADGRYHLPSKPLEYAYLEIDRYCAGSLDWDNALGGLKPLSDVLVCATPRNPDGLGLVRDDNPVAMPIAPRMRQLPAKRDAGHTELRIYRLDSSTRELPLSLT